MSAGKQKQQASLPQVEGGARPVNWANFAVADSIRRCRLTAWLAENGFDLECRAVALPAARWCLCVATERFIVILMASRGFCISLIFSKRRDAFTRSSKKLLNENSEERVVRTKNNYRQFTRYHEVERYLSYRPSVCIWNIYSCLAPSYKVSAPWRRRKSGNTIYVIVYEWKYIYSC